MLLNHLIYKSTKRKKKKIQRYTELKYEILKNWKDKKRKVTFIPVIIRA